MTTKPDINLKMVAWNAYDAQKPEDALKAMYDHAKSYSETSRNWYWTSSKAKRRASLWARAFSVFLLVLGAALPIVAAIWAEPQIKLALTQSGVAALAAAGLLQAADRIFGWSSGWMRYVSTVTGMEAATLKFELNWAGYRIGKNSVLADQDKVELFKLAQGLEQDIAQLQRDETDKWLTEFSAGTNLLADLIKAQRESADKAADAAQAAVQAKEAAAASAAKAELAGAIQIKLARATLNPLTDVDIGLDKNQLSRCEGSSFVIMDAKPGLHSVWVVTGTTKDIHPVSVVSGAVAVLELKVP